MEAVQLILEHSPWLTEREKLEIVNLGWLFTHVPECTRRKAMMRISPLLRKGGADGSAYMNAVRNIAKYLQYVLDEQTERGGSGTLASRLSLGS